ncbi:unnamed protein product [Hyaloperonospora brassicae]|uniref:RxLR effector candidate protein n=1 Tax=Hyaloperonospora brassicae TaxID=162125 RepID=A0AAV0TP25_HYABA|nr:unnamed protein product [Hyaloperonospora brassicae]
MDDDVPEERGTAELGVRVSEALAKLEAIARFQKFLDHIHYIQDMLVTWPKKVYDTASTKFAAAWGKHADAKGALSVRTQAEHGFKIARDLINERAPLSDLAKHDIPPDIYKEQLRVHNIRNRSTIKYKDTLEKLSLGDAYEKLYLLEYNPHLHELHITIYDS